MYSEKNFSIPSECCFEEKHDWGVSRPSVLVLVRDESSFLYLDKNIQAEIPQTELALGETLTEATARVLNTLGYAEAEGKSSFVGYFSVGRRRLPHFLVVHFTEKTGTAKRGTMWIDPVTEVVNHRVFATITQAFLSLVASMEPSDCLGWGENGLIIWPCEEQVAASLRVKRTATERLAA